jgi:DNA uptake protein ComE-like DNA-binding protein
MEKKISKLSDSFRVGVIALVFLIVGYQTALFVYRASVMKIVSNRDEPDTVYIYHTLPFESPLSGEDSPVADASRNDTNAVPSSTLLREGTESRRGNLQSGVTAVQRKSSSHSPVAEAVRSSAPRRHVESFRFNPNTASHEDFRRLGFSEKQAQSIINYREKGGSYKRKEDFARSFVVSDSMYRRLEKYIDIPLIDLNLADSAAFDALPGIGGWFANKMVEYRKALGGYSCKEQLLDIYNFTEEKYRALEDLITVSPEHVTPYPLWTLPADSLRLHPYIKDYETARAIVLYRENSPTDALSVSSLASAGIITSDVAEKLSRCLILPLD